MKKRTIINLIVIVVMLAIVAVMAITIRTTAKVDCADCEGSGSVMVYTENDDGTVTGTPNNCETCEGTGQVKSGSNYYATIMALMPPIIAIVLALITKEVYSSLFVGVLAGALFSANFNPIGSIDTLVKDGLIASLADSWNVGIIIFPVVLGIMVALMNKTGGSAAFGRWAHKHVKTRAGAQLASFVLGVLIFVDDYFNCLTVGSVMLPLSDSQKISRAKLAYIIDATAAPICMIAPISSWAAAVSGMVEGKDGFELFISAIPYNFYSLLTIVMVITIIVTKLDYGPMKKHELNAMLNNDLFTEGDRNDSVSSDEQTVNEKGKVIDLIFPVAVLIICCLFAMVYSGGILDGENFINAFANCDASFSLSWGSIVALVITIIYFLIRRSLSFKEMMESIPQGFCAMVPAVLILTLAWSLNGITKSLGAATFVSGLMESASGSLANFLPPIIFLVACGLSFATGTSWGTFGILIPIVTALFAPGDVMLTIGISACLAGAVCGDHCSPISDTTIMASAGARCNHVNHVATQLPYALTVAAVSFVSFIIASFVKSWFIALPIAIALMIGTLIVIKLLTKKTSKN